LVCPYKTLINNLLNLNLRILATESSCLIYEISLKQMVDALAAKAEEGRGRRRYRLGSCQQVMIQPNPNVVTPAVETRLRSDVSRTGEPGEVKHLSTRRKRNRKRFRQ